MNRIDHRIVEMQFNNRQFESGVKDTLGSLADLKKGLAFDGIASNIQSIADRFSTFGIIGMTVLQELTKAAMNLSKTLLNTLFDPIFEGGKRRATNIEQALFQFRGLGMDIEATMKNVLYAVTDTAYGMDEAAKVASQLGASGMRAGEGMATALRAVSGVAAMTNSSYEDMGRIFTTVAGNGRLMGNQLLQLSSRGLNVAAALAKSMGKSEAAVREMVTKGQISFKMFYEAMDATFGEHATKANETYAGSLANVRANLAKIGEVVWLQHFENMRDIYNSLLVKLKEVQRAVIPFLKEYNEWTANVTKTTRAWIDGWDSGTIIPVFEGVKNIAEALLVILGSIRDAFRDIFPAKEWGAIAGTLGDIRSSMDATFGGQQDTKNSRLYNLTRGFQEFTKKLLANEETMMNIRNTFKGFFAILDIGRMLIVALIDALLPVFGVFVSTGDGVLSLTGSLGNFLTTVRDAIKQSDIFRRVLSPISQVLVTIAEGIKRVVDTLVETLSGMKKVEQDVAPAIEKAFSPLIMLTKGIEVAFSGLAFVTRHLGNAFIVLKEKIGINDFVTLGEKVRGVFSGMQKGISGFFSEFDTKKGLDLFTAGMFGALIIGLKTFIQSLQSFVRTGSGVLVRLRYGMDQLRVTLRLYQAQLQAKVLISIATAIAILAASLWLLSTIDPKRLAAGVAGISVLFAELFVFMKLFEVSLKGVGALKIVPIIVMLVALSTALLILAGTVKILASIDQEELANGLFAIGLLMTGLVASTRVLTANSAAVMKGASGMILFAIAILILTSAVKRLGAIDSEELGKGLLAVGALMAQLAIFMRVTDLSKMGFTKGLGLLLLAAAIVILAKAVKIFSEIDNDALIKGLIGLGVVLAQVAIFVNLTGNAKKVILTAIGLTILGAAMLIFARAIEKMGDLSVEQITKGLTTMGAALGLVTAAVLLMPPGMISKAIALIGIALALNILEAAIRKMGGMSVEEIIKGLITLAGALAIIVLSMHLMTTALPGAAALLIVSGALMVLALVLKILGSMSLAEIGKALLSLVGVLVILGVAATLLTPVIPALLVLAVAIFLFGLAALVAGAGILMFSMALTALAISAATGTTAIVLAITSVLELIPKFLEQIGLGILAIARVITEGAPIIGEMIKALILTFIDVIITVTPQILDALDFLILSIVASVVNTVPQMVDAGLKLFAGILQGIAANIKSIVQAGIDIVLEFIRGINSKIGEIIDTAYKTIIAFVNGLADAIRNNRVELRAAAANLIAAILGPLGDMVFRFEDVGKDMMSGMSKGISSMARALGTAATNVVKGAVDAAKKWLGMSSPSRRFAEIGENTGLGLIMGLKDMIGGVARASENLGETAMNSLKNSFSKISDILSDDVSLVPTITPVIDMSEVERDLKSTFEKTRGIDISTSAKNVADIVRINTQRASETGEGLSHTDNVNNAKISIINHYNVRSDDDIRKISRDLRNILDRYNYAKGVTAS